MLAFGLSIAALLVVAGIATYVLAPKVGPNLVFGVRTGYSGASPEVWARSNRAGGRLLVGIGLVLALLSLLLQQSGVSGDGGILALAVALVAMLLGGVAWLFRYSRALARREKAPRTAGEKPPFRWRYVAVPLALFAASVLLSAYFYPRLEATRLATHFTLRGEPDGWMGRQAFVALMLGIQASFFGVSLALVRWLSAWLLPGTPGQVSAEASQWLVGNLLAVGQIVVLYVMFDAFWYNLYQAHLVPVWLGIIAAVILATLVPLFAIAVVVASRWLSHPTTKKE